MLVYFNVCVLYTNCSGNVLSTTLLVVFYFVQLQYSIILILNQEVTRKTHQMTKL